MPSSVIELADRMLRFQERLGFVVQFEQFADRRRQRRSEHKRSRWIADGVGGSGRRFSLAWGRRPLAVSWSKGVGGWRRRRRVALDVHAERRRAGGDAIAVGDDAFGDRLSVQKRSAAPQIANAADVGLKLDARNEPGQACHPAGC